MKSKIEAGNNNKDVMTNSFSTKEIVDGKENFNLSEDIIGSGWKEEVGIKVRNGTLSNRKKNIE